MSKKIGLDEFCEMSKLTLNEKERFTKYLRGKTEDRSIEDWLTVFNRFFDK